MATRRLYGARANALIALFTLMAAPGLGAASPCEEHALAGGSGRWQAPLSRSVSIKAGALPLKVALERVAASANMRVSYSTDLIPADREVCITYTGVAIGDALADLLKGVNVEPVVAGKNHIVLTPRQAQPLEAQANNPEPLFPLSPIIATAEASKIERHPPSYAFSVIDHETISKFGDVAQALNHGVPGIWAWQTPTGFTTLYSVRGASSFSASAPKIYIDGIEVANPMLATQLQPENIERIEVIRGPQGGALYGGDAISGVTNIVTRNESVVAGAPRLHVRSNLAFSGSSFTPETGVGQDHTLALQVGSAARSGTINVGLGTVGEYLPGAFSRRANVDGNMRLVGSHTLITGTARLASQSTGNPFGMFTDSAFNGASASMRQYTLGTRAVIQQNARIAHSVVLGVDGYSLSDLPDNPRGRVSPADSVLRAAGTGALRTTARISTTALLDIAPHVTTSVTIAAQHSNLHQDGRYTQSNSYEPIHQSSQRSPSGVQPIEKQLSLYEPEHTPVGGYYEQSRSSNGLSAQVDATLFERAMLSAALRLERDQVNGLAGGTTNLPMVAASYLLGSEALNVKVRASYGKAIRWPDIPNRARNWSMSMRGNEVVFSPEQQSGLEAGFDLNVGRLLQLQVTRYDQTASGLIQCVTVPVPGMPLGTMTRLDLQNVGEIGNRGWELQGMVRRGPLSLTGSMALTSSRVLHVANGYTGDLRAGDRMLGVPARTVSASASWFGSGWSTTIGAYRAFDWINYDRLALARDQQSQLTGVQLRDYWQKYEGSTHVRASLTRSLNNSLTLLLTGDNLLGSQTGEPDNLTVLPGRTVTLGIKAAF